MNKKLIMCNKKTNELNNLCYPDDRKPIKSVKDIEDFSFRNKITPEKYIKSRQKNRSFNEKPYSYDSIHDFLMRNFKSKGEDYADMYIENFKKLEKKLLSIGGHEVVFASDHLNMSAQVPGFIHGDSAPFYFARERKSPKGTIIV